MNAAVAGSSSEAAGVIVAQPKTGSPLAVREPAKVTVSPPAPPPSLLGTQLHFCL